MLAGTSMLAGMLFIDTSCCPVFAAVARARPAGVKIQVFGTAPKQPAPARVSVLGVLGAAAKKSAPARAEVNERRSLSTNDSTGTQACQEARPVVEIRHIDAGIANLALGVSIAAGANRQVVVSGEVCRLV